MSNAEHKPCYGQMFPSTLHLASDRPVSGKVFSFLLRTAGGTFRSDREVAANVQEWDDCVACPEFDPCYRLGLGKVTLEAAIGDK